MIPDAIAFGPFRLFAAERRLERAGVPLQLGSRALEILILLTERPGEVVTKKELMSRVWPGITVDESTLRVHVAGLRKSLGEGEAGVRYVANIPGRGYCFVALVGAPVAKASPTPEPAAEDQAHRLPPRLMRMIGREEIVRAISEQLSEQRFVTILGPGGLGKTTVAVAIGHAQLAAFEGAVRFLDLGPLSDPRLVPSAIASTLGLLVQATDPTPSVINFLRDRRMLLILDSCEHVIDTAAALAERIFEEAPQVYILATTRESLRVEGEHVYRLSALDSPPEGVELTAAQALAFPATQLFVERAAASTNGFELTDADASTVAEICRKLDGIALAIELAAARAGAHGVRETASLLDKRFRLLWHGRRTALPRHKTLSATLDWSYDLLSDLERAVLRRLAVFVGIFQLEAAIAVVADDGIDEAGVIDSVSALVGKSLVSATVCNNVTRYRLLDTTRAYALAKLVDSGEADATARRHAAYYCDFLARYDTSSAATTQAIGLGGQAEHLGNVRAAMEWCFFEHRDTKLGTALAAESAPFLVELSLLNECHLWTERALSVLDEEIRGSRRELRLQASLGVSLMFTRGNNEQVWSALTRGLEIAVALGDELNQLRLIGRLHIFHERAGEYHKALEFAERGDAIARQIGDPVGIGAAHAMLGISYHLMGKQSAAKTHLEAALIQPSGSRRIKTMYFGFHHRNRARIALARTLWLRGYPDQAVQVAGATVDEAAAIGHPVTLCIALIWAVSVYHWIGDLARAEESIERFIAHANRYSLAPYYAVSLGGKGQLSVKRGDVDAGMNMLRRALDALHVDHYELLTTSFNSTLAEGLAMTGRTESALALISETIALVKRNGDLFNVPELLRLKGEFLASEEDWGGAEICFLKSLEVADQQGALSWKLRSAMSLSRMRKDLKKADATTALAETYSLFHEGFGTADLKLAKQILDRLE